MVDRLCDGAFSRVGLRYVAGDRGGGFAQAFSCFSQRNPIPPYQHHPRAALHQQGRDGQTDASGAAGHDGGLARKFPHHVPSPIR